MPRPWAVVERVDTPEGVLELRQRGPGDFLIVVGGRVLMSSTATVTERAVAELACRRLVHPEPRVLIGGLGMAFTLRSALDALPARAHVTVVELNPVVERWCRGPLAAMTGHPLNDPRCTLVLGDAAAHIRRSTTPWHSIILDLYEGPHSTTQGRDDPFYGAAALAATRAALVPGGILAVWSEEGDPAFEARLRTAGFDVERAPPPRSGPRHVVFLARRR